MSISDEGDPTRCAPQRRFIVEYEQHIEKVPPSEYHSGGHPVAVRELDLVEIVRVTCGEHSSSDGGDNSRDVAAGGLDVAGNWADVSGEQEPDNASEIEETEKDRKGSIDSMNGQGSSQE